MRRLLDVEAYIHPDTSWRSGFGLRRVGDKYGAARTERACEIALRLGGRSYKPVANILKHGREQQEFSSAEPSAIVHSQVRGPEYYQ